MTSKGLLALAAAPPSVHVTSAVEVPALVLDPTFHVHETEPDEPATGCAFSPAADDTVPEPYVTLAPQVAPGEVAAVMVALAPGAIDAGKLVMVTVRVADGAVATGEAAAVGAAVGATTMAGFVAELVSAMP